jgi:uncharacterized protein (TIGR02246 family)
MGQWDVQSQSVKNDIETIRSLTDKWIEISADGDVDGYLNLVTDDFIWLGSNSGAGYVGRPAVRDFLEPYFKLFNFSMEAVRSEEVVISADGQFAAHQWFGTAVVEAKDGTSASKTARKYFDFWRKGPDGQWRCSRHLFVALE